MILALTAATPAPGAQSPPATAAGTQAPAPAGAAAQAPPPLPKPPDPRTLALAASWIISLPAPAASTPATDGERAYIVLRDGQLVALSLADGKEAWMGEAPDAVESPETGSGLVFLALPQRIEARDAKSGTVRWRAPVSGPVAAPIYWQNGWLLVLTGKGDATMFRAETGEILWTRPLGTPAPVRPAAAGTSVYVALAKGRVLSLALESGETQWEAMLPGEPTSLRPLDDRVFAGCTDRFFYCLSAGDGKTKWRWRTGGTVVGTPVVDDTSVYFLSLDGVLRALDRGNGHQRWKASLPYQATSGPYRFGQVLVAPGTSAEIAAFRTADGKPGGTLKAAGELTPPPLLIAPPAPGQAPRLLVVTGDGKAQLFAAPKGM